MGHEGDTTEDLFQRERERLSVEAHHVTGPWLDELEAPHDLHGAMYLSLEQMRDLRIEPGLSRSQMELVGARTCAEVWSPAADEIADDVAQWIEQGRPQP